MTALMMADVPDPSTMFSGVTVMPAMLFRWRTPQISALRSSLPIMSPYRSWSSTIAWVAQ